jgi:hypothetical protein
VVPPVSRSAIRPAIVVSLAIGSCKGQRQHPVHHFFNIATIVYLQSWWSARRHPLNYSAWQCEAMRLRSGSLMVLASDPSPRER